MNNNLGKMKYIEVKFKITTDVEVVSELLTAFLAEVGYDSFESSDTGLNAFINSDDFEETKLVELLGNNIFEKNKIKFTATKVPDKNWNKVWESGFKAIVINDNCIIRAPFHSTKKEFKYDIIIEPKMSFGTGHHETTSLMINAIIKLNLVGKSVLDMGCGTGVLSILSSMKGAKSVTAIDIDEWAFLNSVENIEKNNIKNIDVVKGDITEISNNKYDVILANINRNILLRDIKAYSESLVSGGTLLLSGFYLKDVKDIMLTGLRCSLKFDSVKEKNDWVSAKFIKL